MQSTNRVLCFRKRYIMLDERKSSGLPAKEVRAENFGKPSALISVTVGIDR